ncbi:MAG TPA: TetR/AcrR family transcriptional regulator [Solirubrobacteraceae bacterium]|nr:TetR/AcrR family transcriptional regulator [Solirubrobacteraceae bacterium]
MASLIPRSANSEKRATVEAAVLAATEGLLAEGRAFADLRVEEIANRAGISRTAFYFYFRGKRELLMRLTEGVAELLWVQAETWWGDDGDGAEALREAVRRVTAVWADHGVLLRAVIEASAYDEVVANFWRAIMGRFVEATRARIEADGVPVPAESTAFALCWMTERAYYQWIAQGGVFDDPRLTDGVAAAWTRTLYGS